MCIFKNKNTNQKSMKKMALSYELLWDAHKKIKNKFPKLNKLYNKHLLKYNNKV
tara:strand:+ start:192 stop:353 length:162 start_codon:yes stop_codon:yes gene_type:complete